MKLSENEVNELVTSVYKDLSSTDMFGLAMDFIDLEQVKANNLSPQEYAINFNAAGFLAGVKFALENIDKIERY